MRSSKIPFEYLSFPDRQTLLIAQEATELLQGQESLLEIPMGTSEMLLYEVRSQRINELIQQLAPPGDLP